MEITGVIHKIYPIETKEYQGKNYKSQQFTLIAPHKDNPAFDKFPCFVVKSDKTIEALSKCKVGSTVTLKFDMTSKEWNGKPSFIENIVWNISGEQSNQPSNQQNNAQSINNQTDNDDIPF